MAKRNRDQAQRGPAPSPPGVAGPPGWHPVTPSRSGSVVHRVVPAHLACRIGARARAGERNAWPAVVAIARPLIIVLVAAWGLGFGAVPVAAQSWMARAMPANLEGGLALFVSALQGSLAAGSAAGGVIYDASGPGAALGLAAAVAAAGSLALLGRAGAAISAPSAGSADLARARGREAPGHRRQAQPMEQGRTPSEHAEICRPRPYRGRCQEGTAMPNAVVMTGFGPPEVLKWAAVPLREPGEGQIRIKVKAAGISPTDLALRAGYLKDIPLPPNAVLGFEAAGTVDAVGLGVTGTSWPTRSPWLADPNGSSPCPTRPPPASASRSPSPPTTALPVPWMRPSPCWPMADSACARINPCPCSRPPRPTASWKAATSTSASSSPSTSAGGAAPARPAPRSPRRRRPAIRRLMRGGAEDRGPKYRTNSRIRRAASRRWWRGILPASWGGSFRSAAGSYRVGASTLGRESWRQGEAAAKGRARPLAASERMSPPASIERAIQVGSQRGLHGPQSASFDWRGGRHACCHRQ